MCGVDIDEIFIHHVDMVVVIAFKLKVASKRKMPVPIKAILGLLKN
jgi:hypothetical protein